MKLKNLLIKIDWLLSSQFGIDAQRFLQSLRGVPRFLMDWRRFGKDFSGTLNLMPCLHDRYEDGGVSNDEYFWQDILVARWIFEAKPVRHVDVGSRLVGFVAHVASFREIEVFDVRPVVTQVPGVVYKKADLMRALTEPYDAAGGYCDSLSCLHVIEHFGLGRYGDEIDPRGHEKGIANMARMIQPGGRFYLSTPIGQERVEFNAHRVFDPRTIIRCAKSNGLRLEELTVLGQGGSIRSVKLSPDALLELSKCDYNLGIFVFILNREQELQS